MGCLLPIACCQLRSMTTAQSSLLPEAASIIRPKNTAFMNNLLVPNQKALKFGLSAILITLPLPTVETTTAAEFFSAS